MESILKIEFKNGQELIRKLVRRGYTLRCCKGPYYLSKNTHYIMFDETIENFQIAYIEDIFGPLSALPDPFKKRHGKIFFGAVIKKGHIVEDPYEVIKNEPLTILAIWEFSTYIRWADSFQRTLLIKEI